MDAGTVPIIAPDGFLEHAISENVYAGTAMAPARRLHVRRRARPRPDGQIGAGLGQTTSTGTITLIAPTVDITHTGQELTVDGVRMVFQMAPGTEAPAEMHFYFPDQRALCMAENATHTLHNLLTLRGALVRDPHVWAHYLTEAIELFADKSDVVFASHHWPTWGTENIVEFLAHAARPLRLPARPDPAPAEPGLHRHRDRRDDRDAAGARAGLAHPRLLRLGQPQRQGHLPALPRLVRRQPGAAVDAPAGGRRQALRRVHGRRRTRSWPRPAGPSTTGDLRWAAEVLDHVVFAEPDHAEAKSLLADVFEQLGLRLGERHLALRVPLRRDGAADRQLRHPDRDRVARHRLPPQPGDAVRRARHPGQRPAGLGPRPRHPLERFPTTARHTA